MSVQNATRYAVVALVVLGTLCPLAVAQKVDSKSTSPCAANRKADTSTWHVYDDQVNRFCFLYPTAYIPILHPKLDCHEPQLRSKSAEANIGVCVVKKAFIPENLVQMAPTGYDSPPPPFVAGKNTFYYYGPGGGGVSYPDGYYFNLRGQILLIYFDGPYEGGEKTPIAATKEMARKLLATFQQF